MRRAADTAHPQADEPRICPELSATVPNLPVLGNEKYDLNARSCTRQQLPERSQRVAYPRLCCGRLFNASVALRRGLHGQVVKGAPMCL